MQTVIRLFAIMLIGGIVTACAPAAPSSVTTDAPTMASASEAFPLTITDAAGQEFTFDAPPKIGCDWYGCYEAMADLGIPLYAGAMAPEETTTVFYSPASAPTHLIADSDNPESWAAAEIDLYMTRVPADASQDPIKAVAPIFYLHHPSYGDSTQTGYQAYVENLRILGQLTGQPSAATAAIGRFETVLTTLRALATPATQQQTVAVLFSGDGYRAIAPGNPFCAVLAEVGLGQCVGEGAASLEISAEAFLALNPDWIVYQGGDSSYQERTDPVWSQLTAVKADQVFDAAGNRYYCCSTRGLIHALQDYVSHILPAAGIPNPGPQTAFDPTQSPLVTAATATATTTATATVSAARHVHTDALGREVELPTNPQRIIAHYYASDMVALGLPMIGTNFVNAELVLTEEQLQGIADIGTGDPNIEKVLSLEPDLIFVPDFTDATIVEQLAQIAPTVVMLYGGDPFARLRLFGEIVGKPDVAEAWIAAYNAKAAAKREAVAPFIEAGESASAMILYGDQQLYLYGRPRLGPTMYDVFGFTVPAQVTELFKDDPDALWQTISVELLPDYAGDRIFLVQTNDADAQKATEALLNGAIWQSLPAVQNGKVYLVSARWALNDPLTLDWLLDEMAAVLAK